MIDMNSSPSTWQQLAEIHSTPQFKIQRFFERINNFKAYQTWLHFFILVQFGGYYMEEKLSEISMFCKDQSTSQLQCVEYQCLFYGYFFGLFIRLGLDCFGKMAAGMVLSLVLCHASFTLLSYDNPVFLIQTIALLLYVPITYQKLQFARLVLTMPRPLDSVWTCSCQTNEDCNQCLCCICLETMQHQAITHLPCGHNLHSQCYANLVLYNMKDMYSMIKCPVCRQECFDVHYHQTIAM